MKSAKIPNTLRRLARKLFEDEPMQESFIDSIVSPIEYPVAIVWLSERPAEFVFQTQPKPDWMPAFVDLVSFEQRPGRHPLHESGAYYCLDASSVFMARGLTEIQRARDEAVDSVLDMCASPGGKSVLAWRELRPRNLVANEVIGKRTGALISNLKRCKIHPSSVISIDTAKLAESSPKSADVVLVDAPCSGQSLVARGKDSPGCFHPATINMNANRQRRILSNSVETVRPGGWLIYMTCTYSLKENERNVDWLLKKNPHFKAIEIESMSEFRSTYTPTPCYRMLPHDGEGAGGFMALMRKESSENNEDATNSLEEVPTRWSSE